jgi:hypothetical protein
MFHQHCNNVQQIEYAIGQIQRDLRQYISKRNEKAEKTYTKILSILVVAWTEESLLKLLYQNNLFSDNEREQVLKKRSLENKWKQCLNIAIVRAFNIPETRILSNLPFTYREYYRELIRIIENDFLQSITIRNRIAHGQWVYAFTNDLKQISQEATRLINTDNIITIQMKMKILKTMTSIISDFCISPDLAKRDFDNKYKVIDEQVTNLHKRNYQQYKQYMINKYNRGQEKRLNNTRIITNKNNIN